MPGFNLYVRISVITSGNLTGPTDKFRQAHTGTAGPGQLELASHLSDCICQDLLDVRHSWYSKRGQHEHDSVPTKDEVGTVQDRRVAAAAMLRSAKQGVLSGCFDSGHVRLSVLIDPLSRPTGSGRRATPGLTQGLVEDLEPTVQLAGLQTTVQQPYAAPANR